MKNSKKTLIIAFILIAMVATMAIGFVGCGGTNLDGVYRDSAKSGFVLKITGNKIQYIYDYGSEIEKIRNETTFKKDKDKLILAKEDFTYHDITLSDKEKLSCKGKTIGGTEVTVVYTKEINHK